MTKCSNYLNIYWIWILKFLIEQKYDSGNPSRRLLANKLENYFHQLKAKVSVLSKIETDISPEKNEWDFKHICQLELSNADWIEYNLLNLLGKSNTAFHVCFFRWRTSGKTNKCPTNLIHEPQTRWYAPDHDRKLPPSVCFHFSKLFLSSSKKMARQTTWKTHFDKVQGKARRKAREPLIKF